jgi:hypothetical protein
MRNRQALLKRLRPYWKMEAANVVLLPLLMLFLSNANYRIRPMLEKIERARAPALALTCFAVAAAIVGWIYPPATRGLADQICATAAAVLAALEYVNYYLRQLQHFDNRADFERLLSGKGLRRSQMARDLDALR